MGRAIPRTALGAATAAVLAVTTAVPPTHAATEGPRPLTGAGDRATPGAGSVVTLVTGDRVLVTRDGAVALPGPDGTTPFTQTRQSGDDLYVYPEGASEAIAAGRVDEELFNVTGLIRQGYDDAHRDTLPLIAPMRTYEKRQRRTEEWYGGVLAPTTPLDDTGRPALAAERQGDLIGVAPGFWGDRHHQGVQGSFGDIGAMTLRRDGETIGESPYPFGVFTVPAEPSMYELTLNTAKIGPPAGAWKRSTSTTTTWTFRSALGRVAKVPPAGRRLARSPRGGTPIAAP
ncbi:hypothetical protein ABZZ80_34570, partial [Streptomyces sp. NPDC006356]